MRPNSLKIAVFEKSEVEMNKKGDNIYWVKTTSMPIVE